MSDVITPPSDALHLRSGLPVEFRYLEAQYPRGAWPTLDIHPMAQHWLEIHGWFRGMMASLGDLGSQLREGRIDPVAYRAAALPRVRQLLGNLHGHHHHESHNYFPAMAAYEPPMARGFELLDRDHDAIEQLLAAMADAGNALIRAGAEGRDLTAPSTTLAETLDRGAFLIGRHLDDEEEIVVPVLTLRGDPFAA